MSLFGGRPDDEEACPQRRVAGPSVASSSIMVNHYSHTFVTQYNLVQGDTVTSSTETANASGGHTGIQRAAELSNHDVGFSDRRQG